MSGISSPREMVLQLVKELVDLSVTSTHMEIAMPPLLLVLQLCVTIIAPLRIDNWWPHR